MVRLISVVACGPGCGNHHEDTHNDAWKESGYEQAANGNLTHSAVDVYKRQLPLVAIFRMS